MLRVAMCRFASGDSTESALYVSNPGWEPGSEMLIRGADLHCAVSGAGGQSWANMRKSLDESTFCQPLLQFR